VLLTAIVQFGIVFRDYMNLTDAVRSGGRVAAISRTATDPGGTARAAVVTAAGGLTIDPARVSVTSTWQPGADVTVTASHPYSFTIFGIPVSTGSLSSSTTQRVE
jgi:hypothetical protein